MYVSVFYSLAQVLSKCGFPICVVGGRSHQSVYRQLFDNMQWVFLFTQQLFISNFYSIHIVLSFHCMPIVLAITCEMDSINQQYLKVG